MEIRSHCCERVLWVTKKNGILFRDTLSKLALKKKESEESIKTDSKFR